MKALILISIGIICMIFYTWGYIVGMNRMQEIHRQVGCESKFQFKPANTVTADCLKYFK